MDLVSFIADIPSVVDGFVKTARVIVAYQEIDSKYVQTVEDAIYYADKLGYLTHFIDDGQLTMNAGSRSANSSPQQAKWAKALVRAGVTLKEEKPRPVDQDILSIESQRILYGLFQKSTSALKIAHRVVIEWAIRLDLIDSSVARTMMAKLSLSMSDRFVQLPGMKHRQRSIGRMRNKFAFLALGCIQIEDAMNRLKHWLSELHDILMASPKLHLRILPFQNNIKKLSPNEDDSLLFVAIARRRDHPSYPIRRIEDDLFRHAHPFDRMNTELLFIDDGDFEGCIIDRRNIIHFLEQGKVDHVVADTERMARIFAEEYDDLGHNITASVGVLPCCGLSMSHPEYHDLVFRSPSDCQKPSTLRGLLLQEPQHTLEERLNFSIKLASAVLVIHSLGIVHKDIRPDSIVLIQPTMEQSPVQKLGEPFLLSFSQSRFQSTRTVPLKQTIRAGRSKVWVTLYRHPRHLATRAHLPYETRDDIFSLGVCLLEIAVWKSLFAWNTEFETLECDTSVLDFSDDKYYRGELAGCSSSSRILPYHRRRDLLRFAKEKIPITLGSAFKDIVVDCLTFGEETSTIANMTEKQKDNVAFLQNQSVNFVQNILTKLRNLNLR
ncbi:hypothetical protein ACEPAF_111 [Sanghuangporus sanghuang]